MPDHLVRTIARAADLRIVAALTSEVATEGAIRHGLSPAATCALGRALTSGLLLATLAKGNERVTIQLRGDGPLGSLTTDASNDGTVRGYVLHPTAGPPFLGGRCSVAEALGRHGVVNVLRDLGLKELYQGQVALTNGEIDEDIEGYLRMSEQVPSALGCEVVLGADGRVRSAGGVLVQALPGGNAEAVRSVQHALRTGALHELLAAGESSALRLAQRLYPDQEIEQVGEERPLRFSCRCSAERIGGTLRLLTTVDLDEMIAEDRPAEVTCNFCNTTYRVERPELERIRAQVAGGPRGSN